MCVCVCVCVCDSVLELAYSVVTILRKKYLPTGRLSQIRSHTHLPQYYDYTNHVSLHTILCNYKKHAPIEQYTTFSYIVGERAKRARHSQVCSSENRDIYIIVRTYVTFAL